MNNALPDWHDLIGAIYDAVMDDALWTPAVGRIMAQVDASHATLFNAIIDPITDAPQLLANHFSDDVTAFYTAYYWKDPWGQNAIPMGLIQSGAIFHGDGVIARRQLRRHETYQDFLKPRDVEVMLCSILFDGHQPHYPNPACLSLFRRPGAEAFSPQDEQLLRHLLPHLQRALCIRRQMAQQHEARSLRETALDQMPQAVVLLDETGRVLFANRRAEAVFRQGEGLTVIGNRLTTADAQGADRIKQALRRAALGVGESVRLEAPARRRQWVVTFSPLRMPASHLATATRILALIASPEQPATDGLPAFAALYRLTPAETRVLQHLLEQHSTQDIAAILAISIKTLRIHLGNLFAKTHTANQRELVRFYLAHPAYCDG